MAKCNATFPVKPTRPLKEAKLRRGTLAANVEPASGDDQNDLQSQRRSWSVRASKPQRLLSVREGAEILNTSEKTIYRRIDDGQLRAVRIGGLWRIEPADIQDYIRDHRSR